PSSRRESARDLAAKTVALVAPDGEGRTRAYCTGVWVSESGIVTARHCVNEENLGDGVSYVIQEDVYAPGALDERAAIVTRWATLDAIDDGHDLALLRASNAPTHPVARPSVEAIHPGAFAQTMGHSLGLWWSYASGDVAAVRKEEISGLDIVWVQATTPI